MPAVDGVGRFGLVLIDGRRAMGRCRKEFEMERMCLTIPIRPGRRDELVEFMREVDGPRHDELGATERRIGVTREVFFLAAGGDHDLLVMYLEGDSLGGSLGAFTGSREPFDVWFKERFAACTGVDLNDPPPLEPAELLAAYATEEIRA
jgi:hypothetical protein